MSWLRTNAAKRTRYLEERDAVTNQLDFTGDFKERSYLEFRLSSLRTAILTLEHSIQKREAQLALCRSHKQEVDGQLEASYSSEDENRPPEEDRAEGAEAAEAAASEGNLAVMPEEERVLLDSGPTKVEESPTAIVVTGEMARMQVSEPPEAPAKGAEASTEAPPPVPT